MTHPTDQRKAIDIAAALKHAHHYGSIGVKWEDYDPSTNAALHRIEARLTSPVPVYEHFDDQAVDFAAKAMKEKLAKKRAEGRGGWQYPDQCTTEFLSKLLREHVDKGDPIDVANLAMMLFVRGDRISPAAPVPFEGEVQEVLDKLQHGWFLVPPEPTDEMIRAYMYERAKGQYPHEDAGGGVARKIMSLLTGKKSDDVHRTYHQLIDAMLTKEGADV